MRNQPVKLDNGKEITWTDNNTKSERITKKRLGLYKHNIHTKKPIPLKDIKIDWKRFTIKVGLHKVVKPDDKGELEAIGTALDVNTDVDTALEAWLKKRNLE